MPGSAPREQRATFWDLAASVRGQVLLAGALTGLGALAGLLPVVAAMALASALVPAVGGDPVDAPRAWLLVVGLVVAVLLAHALTIAGYRVSHRADARFAEELRQRQISHLLALPLDWFGRAGSGRVKKTVQDDVAKVHQLIAHIVPDTVNGVVRPLSSLVLLFAIDWRLGLVGVAPLVLAIASFPLFMRYLATQFERYNAALADLSAATVEFVRGIAPIKVFEAEGRGHRRFLSSAAHHHRLYREWMEATMHGSAFLLLFTSPAFAITTSAVGAGLLIVFGGLSPVAILPAILLAANIAGPLFMLIQMRQFMREADGAARSLEAFFALPATTGPDTPATPDGHAVDVDEAAFRYESGAIALEGVSASLPAGTVTALVGPSGSGKSTLASLVPRLVDPDRGAVRLGGADVRQLTARQLYTAVGFVFQTPYLLRLSVRDNIALARPHASDAEIAAAATAAQIHERILALPRGYDTIVGEQIRLSGGEEQRISIARALLMDTPLLVLDEATAYADPDSEASIQRALAELTRGRALLVIAHRLHTVTGADQLLVLERGRIVARGRHAELVAAGGTYARMWDEYRRAREPGPQARAAGRTGRPS